MKSKILFLISVLWLSLPLFGQFSPGKLMKAHANLEGTNNCTKCHDLGKKVTNNKCLDCHSEIKTLIFQKRGYHGNSAVKGKSCITCHSDHHGLDFDPLHFDSKGFDHNTTGYKLEGKHKDVDCKECHKSANIADSKIKKRYKTYLGLQSKCSSCHTDYHQGTLSQTCTKCHTMEDFKKAPKFDHEKTKYPLKGAHTKVDCKECHAKTTRNNKAFQEFSGIKFANCTNCHKDQHNGQFGTNCTKCHNNDSWTNISAGTGFNHDVTKFPLRGKHASVSCTKCHKGGDYKKSLKFANCMDCHTDHHDGAMKLSSETVTDCKRCHNNNSWKSLSLGSDFDHDKTDFPLVGLHAGVSCDKCHKSGDFKKALNFTNCMDCHDDYHKGELKLASETVTDCKRCHSTEKSFTNSSFGFPDHEKTKFPLQGAHVATPCFSCHKKTTDNRWNFKFKSQKCIDCHDNIHKETISAKYYPEQNCQVCHSAESWKEIKFDHDKTNFKLEGKHITVNCRECHFEKNNSSTNVTKQKFVGLDKQCTSCHQNFHGDQFNVNGVTECKKCHTSDVEWKIRNFNHDNTNFPLAGGHEDVACAECHKPELMSNGKSIVQYKIKNYKCIDCHY
ncbi:MAG: hypothetical protein WC044_08085 [Crocinitomicaceae bacterium]